ncbi:hypothetical protein FGO68_gene10356 [Halteria grandinella]|uniref:Uncharacterized protein n=1 Tax=Halteria grandinella TaxID=5974 RepID=A0A8J8NQG7_HALGN|nr:hypothetical protein FGO68_gene10356 [Halteria grandinella]
MLQVPDSLLRGMPKGLLEAQGKPKNMPIKLQRPSIQRAAQILPSKAFRNTSKLQKQGLLRNHPLLPIQAALKRLQICGIQLRLRQIPSHPKYHIACPILPPSESKMQQMLRNHPFHHFQHP